jgi:hypothetical protein
MTDLIETKVPPYKFRQHVSQKYFLLFVTLLALHSWRPRALSSKQIVGCNCSHALEICSVLAIVWDHSTVDNLYNCTNLDTVLQFKIRYYFYFLSVRWCHYITHGPGWTIAQDVTHWLLLCCTIIISYWLQVRPNVGSVVLVQVLLLTFLVFSNFTPLLNIHLLSTYKTKYTCDINILYHILCLLINCNLAFYWSLRKEVNLSY